MAVEKKVVGYKGRNFLKLRKLTTNNNHGDVWGFTVPDVISSGLKGCSFTVQVEHTTITFQSGCLN